MKNTLEFLYSLRNRGSNFGIERMIGLCQEFGDPQLAYPTIHVAGTNGKGSVCAMLDQIYRSHGYRVGLFTSPHLLELGERVRINGKNLPFSEIEDWVEQLLPVIEKMKKKEQGLEPTFFELITAIAFLEFKKKNVDLAIFETGLGGRLDSTNVLDPELSIITTVGYDHCEILGYELKKIAAEKAGIIKPGKPVVLGWLEMEARVEISKIAQKKKAKLHLLDDVKEEALPITNLKGTYQKRNAALAEHSVELLKSKFPVDKQTIKNALNSVHFPGRWQQISNAPVIILDACHNAQGARVSSELWDRLPSGFQVWFGACGEDRARDVLSPLLERSSDITLFELEQPRSCSLHELEKIVQSFSVGAKLVKEKDIPRLCNQLDPHKTLLVTGSIYLVAAVLCQFKKIKNSKDKTNWQDHW